MTREMKKRSEPLNGLNSSSASAKLVYRAALEAIKCLDKINQEKKAYREVFRQDAVGLRNKLKEYCERLMFYNPLEYGRKAEEVLWRKVFYEVIQVVKRSRDHVRHHGSVDTAYRTHLSAAVGYYQHLLFRLQREFSLKLAGVIDYYQLPDPRTGRRGDSTSSAKAISPSIQEWAQRACHRCLICLGDISRYICDVDRIAMPAVSDRYYHQAFMLFPGLGMPHNQLGTLSGSRYCGCEAAYHYLRCLACEKPFDGASGNLTRLFEKNTKKFFEINKSLTRDLPPDQQRHQDMKRFFIRYVKLLEMFYGSSNSTDMHELQHLCQETLQDFNLCMFYYEPQSVCGPTAGQGISDPGDPTSLQYLDNGIVFKIICCLICIIHLLDKNGSPLSSAATAFMIALFSHILNHIVLRLQGALEDMENPNKILLAGSSLSSENLKIEESSGSDEEMSARNTEKSNKPTKRLRQIHMRGRRRRRRRPVSSSSNEMSDLSDDSDLSEGIESDDQMLSSESDDDDDLASYFDHGSDSDLSESEMADGKKNSGHRDNKKNLKTAWANNNNSSNSANCGQAPPLSNGDLQHIWSSESGTTSSLAHLSEELFSSSLMFLGQDLTQEPFYGQDKSEMSVPPGFNQYVEAQHAADITEKLANFDIETDTDVMFTDTDPTDFFTEPEEEEAENDNRSSSTPEKQDQEQKRLQQTFEVVQGEGLMPTVKVMCDWMRCQSPIITACASSSHSLWQRMSALLNFLPHETDIVQHEHCWIPELKVTATRVRFSDWSQVFPLAEDIEMCQLSSLSDIHSQIDFTTKHRAQLNSMQETFLQICCLRRFGYFLTSMENIEFTYRSEMAMFFGPSSPSTDSTGPVANDSTSLEKMRDTENRRNQLMRDMAQLRLQAEVSELEGSVHSSDSQSLFPPYVLVDAEALCAHLNNIKELADTARCILVIPLTVVDRLDLQKKESSCAREAIRWLETQLRKGNRYIRAQKAKERLSSQQYGHLKKKNREAWYMLELVSCGRYLAQQSGSFNTGHKVVVILTGQHHLTKPPLHPSIQSAKALAEQDGVSVETVSSFFQKWKSVLQHQSVG